jgi:hypothetical protein
LIRHKHRHITRKTKTLSTYFAVEIFTLCLIAYFSFFFFSENLIFLLSRSIFPFSSCKLHFVLLCLFHLSGSLIRWICLFIPVLWTVTYVRGCLSRIAAGWQQSKSQKEKKETEAVACSRNHWKWRERIKVKEERVWVPCLQGADWESEQIERGFARNGRYSLEIDRCRTESPWGGLQRLGLQKSTCCGPAIVWKWEPRVVFVLLSPDRLWNSRKTPNLL